MNDMSRVYYGQRSYPMNPVREKPQNVSSMQDFRFIPLPSDVVTAMCYVPMQTDTTVYEEMKGLFEGTLFPCLCKPFAGIGDRR